MHPKVQLVLADNADLVTHGISRILQAYPDYRIAATVHSVGELQQTLKFRQPDIIIANEKLDAPSDLHTWVSDVRARSRSARVILLGTLFSGAALHNRLKSGALGYLHLYDRLETELPNAIRAVMRGEVYLSPTSNTQYLMAMQNGQRLRELQPQALKVLRLLVRGWHVDRIARDMGLPRRKVYWWRQKLRDHFGVLTNEHLIIRAVAEGFADVPE